MNYLRYLTGGSSWMIYKQADETKSCGRMVAARKETNWLSRI